MQQPVSPNKVYFADRIDGFIRKVGQGIAWVYVLLILTIILQVILRKGFSSGMVALEELQWHFYATGVMFGLSYAQTTNSHVRVDILYGNFSAKTKSIIDIFGLLLLMLPFVGMIFIHSLDFVYDAWRIGESSDSASGLPYRWLVKSVIPLSMFLLALSMFAKLIRDISFLCRGSRDGN